VYIVVPGCIDLRGAWPKSELHSPSESTLAALLPAAVEVVERGERGGTKFSAGR
jgi:hypothetical protein